MLERFRFAALVIHHRIHLDKERVTKDVRKLLKIIDENLYDPDFKISTFKISKSARANFQQQLDATPHLYVRVRRIEVSLFLLDYTDAAIPDIAKQVGYPKVFSFNYTFKKLMQRPPLAERRHWRRTQGEGVAALIAGHSQGTRIGKASIDRLCLVGALSPRAAAFHLAALAQVVSKSKTIEHVESLSGAYLEQISGDPDARAAAPVFVLPADTIPISQHEGLVEAAARPTREALSRFVDEVPEQLQPMIRQLRTHFTTPGYTVEEMKEVLQASTVDLTRFTRAIGMSPWQYALDARMEAASRLLRDTLLSVPTISFLFGYSEPNPFRRIFLQWSGQLTPHEYRARVRDVVARVGPMPEDFVHWRFLERVWGGEADQEEGLELLRFMERVHGFEPCELPSVSDEE